MQDTKHFPDVMTIVWLHGEIWVFTMEDCNDLTVMFPRQLVVVFVITAKKRNILATVSTVQEMMTV